MCAFSEYNPVAVTVYFLSVIIITMFCMNPVLSVISLIGAWLFYCIKNKGGKFRTYMGFILIFLIMSLINPLVSHNGVTVLLVINDNPITYEALMYGISTSISVISSICWFGLFSQIMTSDKLLYVLSRFSSNQALVVSMAVRYTSLFKKQLHHIECTQKALGIYREDNILDSIKARIQIFSVMITWALENGITTADSMAARGYGIGKRSSFSNFGFFKHDVFIIISSISLSAVIFAVKFSATLDFQFYPEIISAESNIKSLTAYISYTILVLLPSLNQAKEFFKWKYLMSKI